MGNHKRIRTTRLYQSIALLLLVSLTALAQNPIWVGQAIWVGGPYPPTVASGYSYQTETLVYGANITNKGGTISASDLQAVDWGVNFAKNTNSASTGQSLWSYFLCGGPFAGNQTNAAYTYLVPGTNVSFIATNASPAGGLLASDYTRQSGFNNPTVRALSMNYTNWGIGTNGFALWLTYPTTNLLYTLTEGIMGCINGGSTLNILPSGAGGDIAVKTVVGNLSSITPANPPKYMLGAGLFGFTRLATNNEYIYQNGLIHQHDTSANSLSGVFYAASPYVLARDNFFSGVSNPSTNIPVAWAMWDSGIPTDLLGAYYTMVQGIEQRLGRTAYYPQPLDAVLILGQSLAVAGGTGTQSLGAINGSNQVPWALYCGGETVPTATVTGNPGAQSAFVTNTISARSTIAGYVESGADTGWRAFADELHYLRTNGLSGPFTNGIGMDTNSIFVINWAAAGAAYEALQKNSTNMLMLLSPGGNVITNVYQHCLNDLAKSQSVVSNIFGAGLNIRAIVVCHGEANRATTTYEANLIQWEQNIAADIMAITGQTNTPHMLSFMESSYYYPATASFPYSDMGMLNAVRDYWPSNKIIDSRYMESFRSDNVHLGGPTMYQFQGEKAAYAFYNEVWGSGWDCVRPTNIFRAGSAITNVMSQGNLTTDTTLVVGTPNYGFTYTNSLGSNVIDSVTIEGANSNMVVLHLHSDPSSAAWATEYYAMNGTNGNPGWYSGARGNIRYNATIPGFITTSNITSWLVPFADTNANSTSGHLPVPF